MGAEPKASRPGGGVAKDELPQISSVVLRGGAGQSLGVAGAASAPTIEGYEVLELLGEGGMGTVWRAVQAGTKRQVALKVMRDATRWSHKARVRFAREIELASRLEHPNITRVYDSGVSRGLYYYAMELVAGAPIDRYVKNKKLPPSETVGLMTIVGRAVEYAHQRGVIHRDLKPSNIFVTDQGRPYVLDFGLAKPLGEELSATVSVTGEVAGTLAFMSPEQASGLPHQVDTRTDVYALGVVLFLLLTGEFPHDLSGDPYQVFGRITREEVRRPRSVTRLIDRELEAVLLKTLAKPKEKRYASVGQWVDDLSHYLDGDPISARPLTAMYYLRKRLWKHRVGVSVATLVGLLFLGVAAFGYPWVTSLIEKEEWYIQLVSRFESKAQRAEEERTRREQEIEQQRQAKLAALIQAQNLAHEVAAYEKESRELNHRLAQMQTALAVGGRLKQRVEGTSLTPWRSHQELVGLYAQLSNVQRRLEIARIELSAARDHIQILSRTPDQSDRPDHVAAALHSSWSQSLAQFLHAQTVPNGVVPQPPRGLEGVVLSFHVPGPVEDPPVAPLSRTFTAYENAISAIALVINGDVEHAGRILDGLAGMVLSRPPPRSRVAARRGADVWAWMSFQERFPQAEVVREGFIRTGSSSWAGYAMTFYIRAALLKDPHALEDKQIRLYLTVAQRLATGLLSRQVSRPGDPRDGLVTGGWGTISYDDAGGDRPTPRRETGDLDWCGVTHNIDAYFFLRDLGRLTGDANYTQAAQRIRDALLGLYHKRHGQLIRGISAAGRDEAQAVDAAYLGSLFLIAVGQGDWASASLAATKNYQTPSGGYRPEKGTRVYESTTLQNFYYPDDKTKTWDDLDFVWTEGSLGVALASHRLGDHSQAKQIFESTVSASNHPRGGLRAASMNIPELYADHPSAGASAWGIIVAKALAAEPLAKMFLDP